MKIVSFEIKYIGDNKPTLSDIEDMICDRELDEGGICTAEELKSTKNTIRFAIDYIGTDAPTLSLINKACIDSDIDDEGLVKTKKISARYEKCEACDGVGNCDDAAGFSLDCGNCDGTGWFKKK